MTPDRTAAALRALGLDGSASGLVDGAIATAAIDAAQEAGALQLDSLEELTSGDVRTKSSARDLVTRVDVECEERIVARLRAAAPGFEIEAEEETDDKRRGGPRWFVDPLDGTVNYVHGIPMFCASIGLFDSEGPALSVVHAARIGETFVAARGRGAWCLRPDGAPSRIRVSDAASLGEAVVATGFPYRRGELANSNLGNFGRVFYDVRGVRRMGSAALDLAYVAAGRIDGFWELHLSPFDLAAGAGLVLEAGGVVTDLERGDDWLRGGHIAAGPAAVVEALLARVHARPDGAGDRP
ncbi:MAG: inositol monophosphatase family protein [Planctomycetota bacterium]